MSFVKEFFENKSFKENLLLLMCKTFINFEMLNVFLAHECKINY